jgi:hypothetical protein
MLEQYVLNLVYLILNHALSQITVEIFALLGCDADFIVVPDVSGQPVGTMFKGQAVQDP